MNTSSAKALASILALAAASACPLGSAEPHAPEHLPRLMRALESEGLKPSLDKDGDIKVELSTSDDGKRTQVGFVTAGVNNIGGIEYFEIWTIVARSEMPFDAATMRLLLNDAARRVMPSWKFMTIGGRESIVAYVSLPTDVSEKQFLLSLGATFGAADKMERELTDGDEF